MYFGIHCNANTRPPATAIMAVMAKHAKDYSVDYCPLNVLVMGVKFYPGECCIKPIMRVLLVRERENYYDRNAVLVKCFDTKRDLGHLDKRTAAVIVPIMDRDLPGCIVKA